MAEEKLVEIKMTADRIQIAILRKRDENTTERLQKIVNQLKKGIPLLLEVEEITDVSLTNFSPKQLEDIPWLAFRDDEGIVEIFVNSHHIYWANKKDWPHWIIALPERRTNTNKKSP